MVATSCDLKAPRCTTIAPPVRFHGPRGGVFVGHRDPGDPRLNNIYIYIRWKSETKFYVCSDVPHTHPAPSRACFRQMRWRWGWQEMKVKWEWRWDESYLTGTQDGEHTKRRGGTKRKHQHQHTWPGAGETLKRQGKGKSGGRRKQTQTGGGGGGRKRLNQPKPQRKQDLPKHARTRTYLERGSTHEIGDQSGPSWLKTRPKTNITTNRDSVPKCKDRALLPSGNVVGQPELGMDSWQVHQLGARLVDLTKKPRRPYLQEKGHACCLSCCCDCDQSLDQSWKMEVSYGCQLRKVKKKLKPGTAARCLTLRHDSVKPEKRLILSIYLHEFLD